MAFFHRFKKQKQKQNKDTYYELYVEFHYIRILEFSMHLEGDDQCTWANFSITVRFRVIFWWFDSV